MVIKYKIVPRTKLSDQGINFNLKKNAVKFKKNVLNNSSQFVIRKVQK